MNDSITASDNIAPLTNTSPLSAFGQWWLGELRALVPSRLINWAVGDVAVTDVMVDMSSITLVRVEAGKPVPSVSVPGAEVMTHPLLRELRAKGHGQVRVLLGADQVLQKSISLPAAIEENLRDVMGFELDRHTPFMAGQAYYDVKLQRRDPQRETIEVLLSVASRTVVDPLLAMVRQAGLVVEGIGVATPAAGLAVELLPANDKPARKWGNLPRLNLALLVAGISLGLLALLLPIWQKREAVITLNPLVGKVSADYDASQRVHEEYTKLVGEYNYITGKKQSMHSSLAILEELTRISPDTTVAQNMDLKFNGKTRDVTVIGEAQAASKVIEALEQSPLFQNATQRSPSRKGSLGTNEWFHVATEVKPKALPSATVFGENPPEPVVAPPVPTPVPAAGLMPSAGEPAAKAPNGNAPAAAATPAKTDVSTVTVVPVPAKPGAVFAEPAAMPAPGATRKQP